MSTYIHFIAHIEYFKRLHIAMILTDTAIQLFSLIQAHVRSALAILPSDIPFRYEGEPFFSAYEALYRIWRKRESQRYVAAELGVGRSTLKEWEKAFVEYGAIGLLSCPPLVDVDLRLERLVVLAKQARPHTHSGHILTLARALRLPGATIELIRRIQRSHGYGQRQDKEDLDFYRDLQRILDSVVRYRRSGDGKTRDPKQRAETFFDFEADSLQHKVELFRELSGAGSRQARPILQRYGVHSSRFYALRKRFLQ
ncbi:MAG: hypothetical protein GY807_21725 [Gammaproteobacteria bacterium]|nr:hypothetical protein [Gammaproteobacteria bacterium]